MPKFRVERAEQAGVHAVTTEQVRDLWDAGRASGVHCAWLDLAACADKADILAKLAGALAFPPWFGQNWDALADCLEDLSWLPASGYLLVLDGYTRFRERSPEDYGTAIEILEQASRTWRGQAVPFWVFLVPSSPEGDSQSSHRRDRGSTSE